MKRYRIIESVGGFKLQHAESYKVFWATYWEDWEDFGLPITYFDTLADARHAIETLKRILEEDKNPKVVYSEE